MTAFYHRTLFDQQLAHVRLHRTNARLAMRSGYHREAERSREKVRIHLRIAKRLRDYPRDLPCRMCGGTQRLADDIACTVCA